MKLSVSNISFVDCYDIGLVINVIRKSEYFICGGDTLIEDELGLDFPIKYTAKLIAIAKFFCKKVFLFAIGANKLMNNNSKIFIY